MMKKKNKSKGKKVDRTFTAEGIKKEWHRIQWPKLTKKRGDQKSVVVNSVSVIVFTALVSAFLVLIDVVIAAVVSRV